MAQKTIKGNDILAKQIRQRRYELGLTIEEAASRAGVGTKTWFRYETGGSIRADKCKGICKALNWHNLPGLNSENDAVFSTAEYINHEAWSPFLDENFGSEAAFAFAAGSDILMDHIYEDMLELSSMPKGTHIGQLDISWLKDGLPEQFLMYYDYGFLYRMKCCLKRLRDCAGHGATMVAHTVLEELIFYLCNKEASVLLELSGKKARDIESEIWVYDLLGDMDIISCLYSDIYLEKEHTYHFSRWTEEQFYCER